jgi:hypothetical protein
MKEIKPAHTHTSKNTFDSLFTKENYRWMLIGGLVIIIGFLLMAGGKNTDPNTFDYNVVYSFRRITLAPLVIVGGLLIEIYAIFKKTASTK